MAVMREVLGTTMSPTVLGASSVIFIIYLLLRVFNHNSKLTDVRTLGQPKQLNYEKTLLEDAKNSKDEPFLLPDVANEAPTLILPTKYINDVKSLPASVASFEASVYRRQQGKYTGIGSIDDAIVHSVKNDLTRNIARTLDGLQDEADFCIPATIGTCEDWTPVTFYPAIARIIAHLSGRIFVGLPLCRNEDWIRTTISYTFDVFAAVRPLEVMNPLLRPFQWRTIPEVMKIQGHKEAGAKMLKPVIEGRLEAIKDPNFDAPFDMIQFLLQNSEEKDRGNLLRQSISQMNLSMAAIHTTAMNSSHVMYDLCAHPEYIQPIREEIEAVLAADGGKFIKSNMNKLRKLDSFIKESQRLSPPAMISMGREAMQDIVLHDGFVIPAGQAFAFSSIGINHDENLFPDAETFKGFRFSELRELPENQNKYQLVTTGLDALSFGHGVHACPGRFFASNEIKIILAGLITRYDFGFGEKGEKGPRPANVVIGVSVRPDTSQKIYFRRRV